MRWFAVLLLLALAAPRGLCDSYSVTHDAEGEEEEEDSPTPCVAATAPVVRVEQGPLRGRVVQQPRQSPPQYFAFEGIPYAAPPVGERRFQAPGEPIQWTEIRNVTSPGPACIYRDRTTQKVLGNEDCLYLNVYSVDPPEFWGYFKLPVIVWFAPEIIGSGSLDLLNPNPILNRRCILVTLNIRQGVMGYLNTEDSDAPGNAGLKDAVMALQWIKNNIEAFGGDNNSITIMGDGTGGAVVNYMMLSPLCKDLFHAAVSMSGNALSPWFYSRQRREFAVSLYEHFQTSHCSSKLTLIGCLKTVEAAQLVENEDVVLGEEMIENWWRIPFVPSVEAPGSSDAPFLTTEPEAIMRAGSIHKVPLVMGYTNRQGIYYLRGLNKNPSLFEKTFIKACTRMMPSGIQTEQAIREIREFYLGNRSLSDAPDDLQLQIDFVKMMTDVGVAVGAVSASRLMTDAGGSVFLYEFGHDGPSPHFKTKVYNATHIPGVALGDDLLYLFERTDKVIYDDAVTLRVEAFVANNWARIITDFARWRHPTPSKSYDNYAVWEPYSLEKEGYYNVNEEFAMDYNVIGERINFWRELARCEIEGVCEENPRIHTQQGFVRGRRQVSVTGRPFYSWQGIPYAQPPLGRLRFQDAQSPEPWEGDREAVAEGSICSQAVRKGEEGHEIVGDEDCLFVNIFSPQIQSFLVDSRPVMMWIGGEDYHSGSSSQDAIGPDYLLQEDVMVVTFNYRIGPLGFLYLEESAPGNAGLKDQVMSLRWVQNNIGAFRGTPQQVTIAGSRAGGASVHLLLLSPLAKGLFHRAIASSGNALDRWAAEAAPLDTTLRLAASVGCANNKLAAVLNCLRDVASADLIQAALALPFAPHDRHRSTRFTFAPTHDFPAPGVEIFLPNDQLYLVKNHLQNPVPFMTGFTTMEAVNHWAFADFENATVLQHMDEVWPECTWSELSVGAIALKQPVVEELRGFYLYGQPLSIETVPRFLDMLTDIHCGKSIYYTVERMAEAAKAPIYEFLLDVSEEINNAKRNRELSELIYGDVRDYLFFRKNLVNVTDESFSLVRQRLLRLWINFVIFGNPTPQRDVLLQNVIWKEYTSEERNYLYIGNNLSPNETLNEERVEFWKKFYSTCVPRGHLYDLS